MNFITSSTLYNIFLRCFMSTNSTFLQFHWSLYIVQSNGYNVKPKNLEIFKCTDEESDISMAKIL